MCDTERRNAVIAAIHAEYKEKPVNGERLIKAICNFLERIFRNRGELNYTEISSRFQMFTCAVTGIRIDLKQSLDLAIANREDRKQDPKNTLHKDERL